MLVAVEGRFPPMSGSLGAAESTNEKVASSEKGAFLVTPFLWAEMFAREKIDQTIHTQWFAGVSRGGPDSALLYMGVM